MTARYSEHVFLVTRIVFAFLYFCHGAQKMFGVLAGQGTHGQPLFLAAGIIEVAGGILIAIGFGTRLAALICSGEMAVAYFMFHAPHSFWPILNHGDIVVAFCFFFLYVAARGAGRFSLDAVNRRSNFQNLHKG